MYGKLCIILAYSKKGKAFATFYKRNLRKLLVLKTSMLTSTYDKFVNVQIFILNFKGESLL